MAVLDGIATAAFALATIALVARYLRGVNRPVLATAALANLDLATISIRRWRKYLG